MSNEQPSCSTSCLCKGLGWIHTATCHGEEGGAEHALCSRLPCPQAGQSVRMGPKAVGQISDVRIVSDGTSHGTKVYADGQEVQGVRSLSWTCQPGGVATAQIELVGVQVDVIGHLSRRPCPKCGDRVCGGDPAVTCCGRDSVDVRATTPAAPGTVDLTKEKPVQEEVGRLAQCRAALERAWLGCSDERVPSSVVLAIRRAMEADWRYLGEEVDRAIATCEAAGLWEAAVNRPAQGVRPTPLALALEEARSALEAPAAGEQRVKENLQAFLAARFQGRQPGQPFVTCSIPPPTNNRPDEREPEEERP